MMQLRSFLAAILSALSVPFLPKRAVSESNAVPDIMQFARIVKQKYQTPYDRIVIGDQTWGLIGIPFKFTARQSREQGCLFEVWLNGENVSGRCIGWDFMDCSVLMCFLDLDGNLIPDESIPKYKDVHFAEMLATPKSYPAIGRLKVVNVYSGMEMESSPGLEGNGSVKFSFGNPETTQTFS
jgi:hypothetical protein